MKMGPVVETTLLTRLAQEGCLLPTLNLYRHGEAATQRDFAHLANLSGPMARRTLDAMVKHDLAHVGRQKRGPVHVARITLTQRGRKLGELLHAADRTLDPAPGNA